MRLGIITDVHANLLAFEVALKRMNNCDQIIHVGDLIGIGPYPLECMELALSYTNLVCLMGNHDYWYAHGIPNPRPQWMSPGEAQHQEWTHRQLGEKFKNVVKKWPFSQNTVIERVGLEFRHYGLNEEKNWFQPIIKSPEASDLDQLFVDVGEGIDFVFFGHHHPFCNLTGERIYVNPGALGCYDKAQARGVILEVAENGYQLDFFEENYDPSPLLEAFEVRKVPERAFIKKIFMPRVGL